MIIVLVDRLHDGYDDVIINNGSPLLSFLSNNNEGNGFPTRYASSNTDAIATTTTPTIALTDVIANATALTRQEAEAPVDGRFRREKR